MDRVEFTVSKVQGIVIVLLAILSIPVLLTLVTQGFKSAIEIVVYALKTYFQIALSIIALTIVIKLWNLVLVPFFKWIPAQIFKYKSRNEFTRDTLDDSDIQKSNQPKHSFIKVKEKPDELYKIDGPEHSELFIGAMNMAGTQIQEQFIHFNTDVNIFSDKFRWIKADLNAMSLDNFTISYKNIIVAILVEIMDSDGISSVSEAKKELLKKVCIDNNLIPSIFKLQFISTILEGGMTKSTLKPVSDGWNLFDLRTNQKIYPEIIGTDEAVKLSQWEFNSLAIQVVRKDIEENGSEIISYSDLLAVHPQIWFEDVDGNLAWVIVEPLFKQNNEAFKEWIGIENKRKDLLPGYFGDADPPFGDIDPPQVLSSKNEIV